MSGEASTATTVSVVIATKVTVTITEVESSPSSRPRWMNIGTSVEDSTPPITSS